MSTSVGASRWLGATGDKPPGQRRASGRSIPESCGTSPTGSLAGYSMRRLAWSVARFARHPGYPRAGWEYSPASMSIRRSSIRSARFICSRRMVARPSDVGLSSIPVRGKTKVVRPDVLPAVTERNDPAGVWVDGRQVAALVPVA
jgi:hypothetical protein